jgi:hypothetical protein
VIDQEVLRAMVDDIDHIIDELIIKHPELMKGRKHKGGYFAIAGTAKVLVPTVMPVGIFPAEKGMFYYMYVLEKMTRLFFHPGHLLSRESRDLQNKMYCGAVRVTGYIISFSGLPEDADEAVMVEFAYRYGLITDEYRKTIAEFSHNPFLL